MERVKNIKFRPTSMILMGNYYKIVSTRVVGLVEDGPCQTKDDELILHLTYNNKLGKPEQSFVKLFELKIHTGKKWYHRLTGLGGYSYVTVAVVLDDILGKLTQEIIPLTNKHKSILMLVKHLKAIHKQYEYVEGLFNPHIGCMVAYRCDYTENDLKFLMIKE